MAKMGPDSVLRRNESTDWEPQSLYYFIHGTFPHCTAMSETNKNIRYRIVKLFLKEKIQTLTILDIKSKKKGKRLKLFNVLDLTSFYFKENGNKQKSGFLVKTFTTSTSGYHPNCTSWAHQIERAVTLKPKIQIIRPGTETEMLKEKSP